MDAETKTPRTARARLFAFAALAAFTSTVGYVAHQAYRAATDSFVAPIILSPDNDLVIANRVKMAEFDVERSRAVAELEAIDQDLATADKAIERLRTLRETVARNALAFTQSMTTQQAALGPVEMRTLAQEKHVLEDMVAKQQAILDRTKENMDAGLVSKMEHAKEEQAFFRAKAALLEADRTLVQAQLMNRQVALAQRSLASQGPMMPEQLAHAESAVRIDLEIMKLESEQRAKRGQRTVVLAKLARLDELEAPLKGRPLARAMNHEMQVAFVPYTQIEGIKEGRSVYDCVWGLFHCKPVGRVAELVPGEVILPDPWGNLSRGQYAVLDVDDREAMKSKTLRVRPGTFTRVARTTREHPEHATASR